MRRNSGLIGAKHKITGNDPTTSTTSGIYDMLDQHMYSSIWPLVKKHLSCTESTSTVVEGNSMTFTVVTEGYADGTTLYYTVNTVSGTAMNSADFSAGDVSGSFILTSNSAIVTFGFIAEMNPGDAESNIFKLEIRTGSTGGPIVLESGNVTITDAISYGTDIRTNFYEISNRYVIISSNDYSGAWDVGEIQQGHSGVGRLFIVLKCNTSTNYYNDICVAAVQVLDASNVIQQTWNFSASTVSWESVVGRTNGTSSLLSSYLTPSGASGLSYTTGFSNSTSRMGWSSNTGSNNTGMADGITNSTTTLYTVGNGTVSQASGTNFIYGEVSGAARYSHIIARSPSRTWTSGEKIRIVHNISIPSTMTGSVNVNDALWIGIY